MTAAIERLHWLNAREHADLLTHAACGDWLLPPSESRTWFAPTRVSRGDRVLLFCYEADRATIGLCAVLPRDLNADWVLRVRDQLSPSGAEAKWGHFVGQLGRYESVTAVAAPAWSESAIQHGGRTWRARRVRHPSSLIDRLLTRDRAQAETHFRAALCDRPARSPELEVGEAPRTTHHANMGDKRSGGS